MRSVEKATGERWDTCPWQALSDPFVAQVFRAYPHWRKGALGALYGGDDRVPAVLLDGLATYDAAVHRVQAHDLDAERKRREREAAEQTAAMGSPFARPIPAAPRHRRR